MIGKSKADIGKDDIDAKADSGREWTLSATRVLNTDGGTKPAGRVLAPQSNSNDDGFGVRRRTSIVIRNQDDVDQHSPPLYPIGIGQAGGSFELTFAPSRVHWFNPAADMGDPIQERKVYIGASPLDADPPPTLVVDYNEWVYLKYKTDKKGQITDEPELTTSLGTERHYIPEFKGVDTLNSDPSVRGQDGEYYIKVVRLLNDGDGGYTIEHGLTTDPLLEPYLWTPSMVGDGLGIILKQFNVGTGDYEFKTIRRDYGTEIIDDDDEIQIKFSPTNTGGGVPIVKEDGGEDEDAEFKTLMETGQVQVREIAGPAIEIRGNRKNGSLEFTNCDGVRQFLLEWEDGLIITETSRTLILGDCETQGEGP